MDQRKDIRWMAGLIDGDGYIGISKAGYCSIEITMALEDNPALMRLKNKYGGSVIRRAGVRAVRYRMTKKEGVIAILKDINGEVRNSVRIPQMKRACEVLGITYKPALGLEWGNGWAMGMFDSDGCITGELDARSPSVWITITSKSQENLKEFPPLYGGTITHSKSGYGHYVWRIASEADLRKFLEYEKENASHSHKKQRLTMLENYYRYKRQQAHNAPEGSVLYKAWNDFKVKWQKRED